MVGVDEIRRFEVFVQFSDYHTLYDGLSGKFFDGLNYLGGCGTNRQPSD